jgi:Peptidase family M1 domain
VAQQTKYYLYPHQMPWGQNAPSATEPTHFQSIYMVPIRRFFLLYGLSLVFAIGLRSQPLYMPRDVSRAFQNQTRSMDGKPGMNYWQNRGRYQIRITVLPPDRNIKGAERITYLNNSPNFLRGLVIKLFMNIHRPGAPRYEGVGADYLTTGIHIDKCAVNGDTLAWTENPNYFTWQPFTLPKPLAPHDSITLTFEWHYQISLQSGREGMIDSTTYFLAYFYPRVAVYDDCDGWDGMTFTDSQEFYSDFNDYDVTLQVPKNYLVLGTGSLQHPESLLQPNILKRFNQSMSSDQTISVATTSELTASQVTTQNDFNSWQFKASNVPDMAFGLSNHYAWDAASVVVDDASGRRASVQAAYNDTAADFHHMVQFGRYTLAWLSRNWPGIPYPYEKTTIFQGFADMEYPMMVNDQSEADTLDARSTADHEIAHTYMPFYMGINETRYGFMDEGWATTFELLIGRSELGGPKADEIFKSFRINRWAHNPASYEDLPIITPGDALYDNALGNNEYGKASLGYLAAKDLLGDEMFKKCLHAYMDRWHGKHPIPWDFFHTFNDISGQNLNWFWSNWFFSNSYIDLAIENVVKSPEGYQIMLKNKGGMAAPVDIVLSYSDGFRETRHQTPQIWQANGRSAVVDLKTSRTLQSAQLQTGIFVDANETDNGWRP